MYLQLFSNNKSFKLTTQSLIMNSSTRRKLQSSLLLLLALLPYILAAQVYNGNVNLTSQAQVNAFGSNYTKIVGKLDINGTDITDLTPLSNIDTVTGKLEIFFTDSLQTLNGLNISYVGGNLYFEKNKKLKDIGALSSLTFVGKDLVILNCKSLNNLNGLQNIDTIKGNLYIGVKGWLTQLYLILLPETARAKYLTVIFN